MRVRTRPRLFTILVSSVLATTIALSLSLLSMQIRPAHALPASQHQTMNCVLDSQFCTEVFDSERVFGENVYVGHDEPSVLFYSNRPGSGNHMQYELTLPKDPPPTPTNGRTYNIEAVGLAGNQSNEKTAQLGDGAEAFADTNEPLLQSKAGRGLHW
ncbi:MAG TPA: hypothetical protein VFV38_02455 [Ktedonobacteraceae bacterium]|nr:hypothetical protein [Ktedonobacteraceae bacterium]